jgi:hypothetical protein
MRVFTRGIRATARTIACSLVLVIAVGGTSSAGGIADEFKAGVLGLPWGCDIDVVVQSFPNGTHWPFSRGDSPEAERFYSVADDLPLLDVERENQSTMFGFDDSNRLVMAVFSIPYAARDVLVAHARTIFGTPARVKVTGLQTHTSWRTDDGVTFSIFEIPHQKHGAIFIVVSASEGLMKSRSTAS